MSATPRIAALRAFVYRCPIETPVTTSFGVMFDRPMVVVEVEDEEGAIGWGEIWCNFPAIGAEHRARMVERVLAPLTVGQEGVPEAVFAHLSARTAVLAIQSGEPGPIAQAIAGVDIALWDLRARRAGQPLWRLLGGGDPRLPVYASGINPDQAVETALAQRQAGFTAFKLKVGFGQARDLDNLRDLRAALGESAKLMVDANQGWSLEEAARMLPHLAGFGLGWVEEPLRADRPWAEWRHLAGLAGIPLAAGENLLGQESFAAALACRALRVMQPDIAKWGGFSGCLPVARAALAAGLIYCPHWLGGGLGLLASAHLLAAVGGEGMLEIDSNPNPLREMSCGPLGRITQGHARLSEAPGLGIVPDLAALGAYRVAH